MDFVSFIKSALVGSVPLFFVIVGVTEWFKKFSNPDGSQKFGGNQLLIISMASGVFFGGCYMVTQQRPPAEDAWVIFVYGFSVLIYGIASGLVASGLYDVVKNILKSITESK